MLLFLLACPPPTPDKGSTDLPADDSAAPGLSGSWTGSFTPDLAPTAENPLRGMLTSYAWGAPSTDFPHSLEFLYVPLSDLMDGPDSFTWEAGLDAELDAAAGRGHQVIVRPWLDYPSEPTGVPAFLASQIAFNSYSDYGGGQSPDYSDPILLGALEDFIAAMGERYDGDPRIAFVQLGLLGFWGEWHTYPHEDWFADQDGQRRILDAYEAAFTATQLQARYADLNNVGRRIGYHDDSFAYSTIGSVDWFFLPQIEAVGAGEKWEKVAIGGELRPELQATIFSDDYETGTYAQDFDECVAATHASYLLNYQAFAGAYSAAEDSAAREAALSLGYAISVESITVTLEDGDGSVDVALTNLGSAPFYYDLELFMDSGPSAAVPRILPGESATVNLVLEGITALDTWNVQLRSPHTVDGQIIRFANASDVGGVIEFAAQL